MVILRLLVALALGPLLALACGPSFNDAHHGLRDPLPFDLDLAARALFLDRSEDDLELRWRALLDHDQRVLQQAIGASDALPALRATWTRWLGERGRELEPAQRVVVADRLATLAPERSAIDPAQHAAYRDAAWTLIRAWPSWRNRSLALPDPVSARARLLALVEEEHLLAAPARLVLARDAILDRDLARARALLAPEPSGPVLRDHRAYLQALVAFSAWRLGLEPVDEATAAAAMAGYLAAWPAGAWRADARGWLAHLAYRRGDLTAATADYQALVADPELPGGYRLGLDSLRLCYRRLRPELPAVAADDARFALAWLVHAAHDGSDHHWAMPIAGTPRAQELAVAFERILAALPATERPPAVATQLAQLALVVGRRDLALELSTASPLATADPWTRYLRLRTRIELGDGAAVYAELAAGPGDPPPAETRDLLLRLGSARERAGDPLQALRCYVWADSALDVAVAADGVVPILALEALLAGDEPLRAWALDGGPGRDYRAELRTRLGIRLVRVGRGAEARAMLDGDTAAAVHQLLALEAAAAQPDADAAAHYALAAFWYHRGREVLVLDRWWHQWAAASGVLDRPEGRRQRVELELATGYLRAREIFLGIARDWPDSPEAPKALYSAAACNYWLCQPSKCLLGHNTWWERRAEAEGLWAEGDALMRRLRRRYPDHPLAQSEWIREQVLAPGR